MNNTKWKKLINCITSNPEFDPPVNIKYVSDNENSGSFSPVWWEQVEQIGFKEIEWLEIKPHKEEYQGKLIAAKFTDFTPFIRQCLIENHIPYEENNGIFRIYGYLGTGK